MMILLRIKPAGAALTVLLAVLLFAVPSAPGQVYGTVVSEKWMSILFNNRKIGFSYQKTERGENGYKITERAVIKLKIMNVDQDMSFSNVTYLDNARKTTRFVYLQTMRNQRQRTVGVIKNNEARLTITGAGGSSVSVVKTPSNTVFTDAMEFALPANLAVGMELTVPVFIKSLRTVSSIPTARKTTRFVYLQTMRNQRQRTVGVIKNNEARLTITGAGGSSVSVVKTPSNTVFTDAMEFALPANLAVGMELTVPVFIKSLRTVSNLQLNVAGKETIKNGDEQLDVFVVESSMMGVKTISYVTPDGQTVREKSFMGFDFVKTDEASATRLTGANVPITSLITFSLITPDKPVENASSVSQLKIEISGLTDPAALPSGKRQTAGEPRRVIDGKHHRTFTIPLTVRRVVPLKSISIKEASLAAPEDIKPTPEIQSDNRMIKMTAEKIIGDETDAWQSALKINRWVYKNISKELVDSFSAIDVLLSRKGECQSNTNLFAAFARSVGIPTRVAGGLVYSSANKGFLYHAWPEVYVGQWVAMDPTLGEQTADATHIKLIEGGVESQLQLMRYIGRISVSVKSYSH